MTLPRAILQDAAYLVDLGGTRSRRGARDPYEGAAHAFRDAWSVLDDELRAAIDEEARNIAPATVSRSTMDKERADKARSKAPGTFPT